MEANLFDTLEHAEFKILRLLPSTTATAAGGHRENNRRHNHDRGNCAQPVFHEIFLLGLRALPGRG